MSAAALGEELLGEVKEEGLNELFRSLREATGYPGPKFGFPPFDDLLNAFQHPPITRQQEQFHTQWSTQHQLSHATREKSPSVMEISGATACSGKTQLLYHLITIALLPPTSNDIALHGKGQAVVLFDLSGRISILRLREHMLAFIISKSTASHTSLSELANASLISDSLMHLHIFRPHSSSSLLATLKTLPSYLLSSPSTHFSTNRALGLLAISDFTSFLWQDRQEAEEAGLSAENAVEKEQSDFLAQRYRDLVFSLRNIHDVFSCTIAATTWGLAPVTPVAGQPAMRPHFPAAWNTFCTAKVVVERERVSKFGPGMSVEEASAEKAQRWEAVGRSGFTGWVNWWGSDGWRDEVREAVRMLNEGGAFSFRVAKGGLVLDDDDQ